MPGDCYRCGDGIGLTAGAAISMTSMHSDGVGELYEFLCDDCAEIVRDVLEGEDT